jgi:hypothetical protein
VQDSLVLKDMEPIEDGPDLGQRSEAEFPAAAKRFRDASDREEVQRLGDDLGRMIFGQSA